MSAWDERLWTVCATSVGVALTTLALAVVGVQCEPALAVVGIASAVVVPLLWYMDAARYMVIIRLTCIGTVGWWKGESACDAEALWLIGVVGLLLWVIGTRMHKMFVYRTMPEAKRWYRGCIVGAGVVLWSVCIGLVSSTANATWLLGLAVLALVWQVCEVTWLVTGRPRQLAQSQLGPSTAYSIAVSCFIALSASSEVDAKQLVAVIAATSATAIEELHFHGATAPRRQPTSSKKVLRMPW